MQSPEVQSENHFARKTSIAKLLHNDVHPIHVVQLSGHKNLESLNHYNTASPDQQLEMSNIISGRPKPKSTNGPITQSPASARNPSPLEVDFRCQHQNHSVSVTSKSQNITSNTTNEDLIAAIFRGATLSKNIINIDINPFPQ